MAEFVLFRCPVTGAQVRAGLPDRPFKHSGSTYEAFDCAGCGGVHLVNPASGKLLEDKA